MIANSMIPHADFSVKPEKRFQRGFRSKKGNPEARASPCAIRRFLA